MGRIVVNKHFNEKDLITSGSFSHIGEIIVSNEVGKESIAIKNTNDDVVFINAIDKELEERIGGLELSSHTHNNKEIIDEISSEKINKWDSAENNAKKYTDEKVAAINGYEIIILPESAKESFEKGSDFIYNDKVYTYNPDALYFYFEEE